jgi:hypothetical protein
MTSSKPAGGTWDPALGERTSANGVPEVAIAADAVGFCRLAADRIALAGAAALARDQSFDAAGWPRRDSGTADSRAFAVDQVVHREHPVDRLDPGCADHGRLLTDECVDVRDAVPTGRDEALEAEAEHVVPYVVELQSCVEQWLDDPPVVHSLRLHVSSSHAGAGTDGRT